MLIEVREGAAYVNDKRVTSIQELRTADDVGGGTSPA